MKENRYIDLFGKCKYDNHDGKNLVSKIKQNDLFLIHINIRSIQKNIDALSNYLASLKKQPDIVAISETKLKEDNIYRNINLNGYTFIHKDSKTCAGGVGLYLKNNISYSMNQCSNNKLTDAEHLWVNIETKEGIVVIGVVYRHPVATTSAIDNFNKDINEIFLFLNSCKRTFHCIGDFNVDLLQISNHDAVRRYANMLLGCNCKCIIAVPTRIAPPSETLIDHIYTNNTKRPSNSAVLTCDLSDHYPVAAIISAIKKKKHRHVENYLVRNMTNFNLDAFLDVLNDRLNNEFENISAYTNANELFNNFVVIFQEVINNFAPMRKATRKEKKLRLKPWLTKGILQSIKTKNKLFKHLHRDYNVLLAKKSLCIE